MFPLYLILYISVLAVLSVAAPLFSPFFRRWKVGCVVQEEGVGAADGAVLPPVSIVIVAHDSAFRLEQVLPRYLGQDYEAGFQVVVVIDQNDSESEDVLKRHSGNPHLYYTMLPTTSRYLSRKKLGITLGMRAAKHDWVVVTDVHCAPESTGWLRAFARHCTAGRNMVLGLTPYEAGAPAYCRFEHLRTMLYLLGSAECGLAFATNQSVVAVRREEFFARKGFCGNLEFTRAEFEFLVNKFARKGGCGLATEREAWLRQFVPNPQRWRGRQLFALDALNGLRGAWRFCWLCRIDLGVAHLFSLLTLVAVVVGLVGILQLSDINSLLATVGCRLSFIDCQLLILSSAFLWILSQMIRCFLYAPVLRRFQSVPPLVAVALEWTVSMHNLSNRIRYWLADKDDFITHKL